MDCLCICSFLLGRSRDLRAGHPRHDGGAVSDSRIHAAAGRAAAEVIHAGTPFRGNYAAIGMRYDEELDQFVPVEQQVIQEDQTP
jgi:hypothetical protein